MQKYGMRKGVTGQHLGQVLLLIVVTLQILVFGDTGLGTSVIGQIQSDSLMTPQQRDLWEMWAGNSTNMTEPMEEFSEEDSQRFFGVLSDLTSTWRTEQLKAAKLPNDLDLSTPSTSPPPIQNQIQFPVLPELSLVVADVIEDLNPENNNSADKQKNNTENELISPETEEINVPELELILPVDEDENITDSEISNITQNSNQNINSSSSDLLGFPSDWGSMSMLQSFSTAFPADFQSAQTPPKNQLANNNNNNTDNNQQGGVPTYPKIQLNNQSSRYNNQYQGNIQSSGVSNQQQQQQQATLLKANTQGLVGNGPQEQVTAENETSDASVPVLPMPVNTMGQPTMQQQQQQQQQTPLQGGPPSSPAATNISSSLPFPIPIGATAIPSAPLPIFAQSPSLNNVSDPFRSISMMGNAMPIPSLPPSPVTTPTQAQQQQQQQQGMYSTQQQGQQFQQTNNPFLLQQQQQQQYQNGGSNSGVGMQQSPAGQSMSPQAPPSYSSSCSGRSDRPGQGTRCGCANIVPEGFCACTQVFYMQQCASEDVATPNPEVPNGYCDVTCGRCECCPSVYEQAKNLNLTTFVEMLDKISLVSGGGMGGGKSVTDSLKNPSHTSTVFIPTDEAFRQLYEEDQGQTKTEFLAKTPLLFEIAQTHVLLSLFAATADELMSGELGTTLATQQPSAYLTLLPPQEGNTENLEIQAPGSTSKIIQANVNGCHSMIHIIDEVLLSYEPDNKYG